MRNSIRNVSSGTRTSRRVIDRVKPLKPSQIECLTKLVRIMNGSSHRLSFRSVISILSDT